MVDRKQSHFLSKNKIIVILIIKGKGNLSWGCCWCQRTRGKLQSLSQKEIIISIG